MLITLKLPALLPDLLEHNNILCENEKDDLYSVTESGMLISSQLDISLPISVRERALSATMNLLAKIKREQENRVRIQQTEQGYMVSCSVSGGNMDLMSLSLYVPDMLQAKMVKKISTRIPLGFIGVYWH